jgi:hypothetical protein
VSEQNPSADAPEERGSFGSASGSVGSASGASEQVGSAPAADETVGSAPPPAAGPPGAPPADTPGAPGAPAAEPKKGGNTALAWIVGAVVVIALALGVGWLFARNNVTTFKVGDCLSAEANSTSDASKVKKVDCTSEAAAVKVVGVVEGLTRAEFDATEPPCEAYEEAQSALWIGTSGKGKTYCLEPVGR